MQLYLANPTRQTREFFYRIPTGGGTDQQLSGLRSQSVPIGGQIIISGDYPVEVLQRIIDVQIAPYGGVGADELDRHRGLISMIYSVGKAVPVQRIERVMRNNIGIQADLGREMRRQAAVAESNQIDRVLDSSGVTGSLRALEMTIQEENHSPDSETPQISEGIRVTSSELGGGAPAPRAARGARGRNR